MEIFKGIFELFHNGIIATLNGKSAAVIGLITPVLGIGFALYLMLIAAQAMRGSVGAENFMDFFLRCIGWAAVITFGLNIDYYFYVVEFFNGLGADLSGVLAAPGSPPGAVNSGAMLDGLLTRYGLVIQDIWDGANDPVAILIACFQILILIVAAAILLGISTAYILLAQIALGVLLAIGPIFISLALFPATRKFFEAWIGQCVNYVILTILFNFLLTLQADFIQIGFSNRDKIQDFLFATSNLLFSIIWILVSLNMPSLASALAGGVGISSMVGNAGRTVGSFGNWAKGRFGGGDNKDKEGGEIKKK
jgi:type IV secretion system protein VirB6